MWLENLDRIGMRTATEGCAQKTPHNVSWSHGRVRMTTRELIDSIEARLREFGQKYEGLSLREKVLRLVEVLQSTRKLNVEVARESGCDAATARERIRLYLVRFVGHVIEGAELEVVSGISEYARRARELRIERGYRILTGASND